MAAAVNEVTDYGHHQAVALIYNHRCLHQKLNMMMSLQVEPHSGSMRCSLGVTDLLSSSTANVTLLCCHCGPLRPFFNASVLAVGGACQEVGYPSSVRSGLTLLCSPYGGFQHVKSRRKRITESDRSANWYDILTWLHAPPTAKAWCR